MLFTYDGTEVEGLLYFQLIYVRGVAKSARAIRTHLPYFTYSDRLLD